MSLDVYLVSPQTHVVPTTIPIREDGQLKTITLDEWNARYPDREPLVVTERETTKVYWANITHNLNRMAKKAMVYEYLWRPGEVGAETARQLIEPLRESLVILKADPKHFKQFNPSNGWGDYDGLVSFIERYLEACIQHPDAKVSVSR